jgi:hypothetical protein
MKRLQSAFWLSSLLVLFSSCDQQSLRSNQIAKFDDLLSQGKLVKALDLAQDASEADLRDSLIVAFQIARESVVQDSIPVYRAKVRSSLTRLGFRECLIYMCFYGWESPGGLKAGLKIDFKGLLGALATQVSGEDHLLEDKISARPYFDIDVQVGETLVLQVGNTRLENSESYISWNQVRVLLTPGSSYWIQPTQNKQEVLERSREVYRRSEQIANDITRFTEDFGLPYHHLFKNISDLPK